MRAMSTAASAVRHTFGVAFEALILLAIVAALAFGVALASGHPLGASSVLAAKGGNAGSHGGGGGGTGGTAVTITVPDGVFGGTTTASVSGASGLWVDASCSQNGVVVYQQFVLTDSAGNAVLTLGPTPMWSSGAATCGAQAGSFSNTGAFRAAAYANFSVSG